MQEQLEAALELTRQQLGQATREAAASGKAWGRQRLLQDRLVNVRATLCHLAQVSISGSGEQDSQACAGCIGGCTGMEVIPEPSINPVTILNL